MGHDNPRYSISSTYHVPALTQAPYSPFLQPVQRGRCLCLDCYGFTNRRAFLTLLEAANPRWRCRQVWSLVRALFPASRWLPSRYVLTWRGEGDSERAPVSPPALALFPLTTLFSELSPGLGLCWRSGMLVERQNVLFASVTSVCL